MPSVQNLILCPLKAELRVLLSEFQTRPLSLGRIEGFYSEELASYFVSGGHGKVAMALSTQKLLQELPQLKRAFCIGVAGALNPELGIGDIVVAEKIIEHDFKVGFIKKKPPQFRCNKELVDLASKFGALPGIICSGDEDICSVKRALELRAQFHGEAVAWEGAGFARACRQFKLPFLEVRGISDNCEVPEDFEALLEKAMGPLRSFTRSLLEQVQEAPL